MSYSVDGHRNVSVTRDRRAWALAPALMVCVFVAIVLCGIVFSWTDWLAHKAAAATLAHIAVGLCAAAFILSTAVLLALRAMRERAHEREIVIDDDVLILRSIFGNRHLGWPARRQGWIHTAIGVQASLLMRRGVVVTITCQDLAEAEAILTAAGVDARRRAVQTMLGDVGPWSRVLAWRRTWRKLRSPWASLVVAPGAVMAMHALAPHHALLLLAAVATWVALRLADAMLTMSDPARVTVGSDGLFVEGWAHRRFVPLADLSLAEASDDGIAITMHDGTELQLPFAIGRSVKLLSNDDHDYLSDPEAQLARRDALMEQLRVAVAAWHNGATPSGDLSLLARNGRSIIDWSRGTREAMLSSYRVATLSEQQLAEIVRTPTAPRERRVGAALALAGADDRAVELAIDATADPVLSAALRSASSDELEERHLRRLRS